MKEELKEELIKAKAEIEQQKLRIALFEAESKEVHHTHDMSTRRHLSPAPNRPAKQGMLPLKSETQLSRRQ